MVGRLEATLHHSLAEVAFLFSPSCWGRGYAREGLVWMHHEIQQSYGINSFWATTEPANTRCQALLRRSGYRLVPTGAPLLYSLEAGDLAFHLRHAA